MTNTNICTNDLQYLISHGIMNPSEVQSAVSAAKKKEMLDKHSYQIWQGTDGKWHTYLPDLKKGRVQRKRNTKEELEDVIVEHLRMIEENPTIYDIYMAWSKEQADNGFIKTNTVCRNDAFFKRHFNEFGEYHIKDVDVDMWVGFLESQIPKYHLTAKSFAGLKTITKGIIKKAKRKKYIDYTAQEVMDELIIPKNCFTKVKKKDEEEVYTVEETAVLMDYCKEHRDIWTDCITLIFVTGLRVGEATAIRHEDINPKKMCIYIHGTESRKKDENGVVRTFVNDDTKTDAGVRTVYIPKQYQYLITSLWWSSSNREYVFEHDGIRVHTNAVRKKLRRICEKNKIPYKPPHKIRKTFCSILLDNQIDSHFVTSQMGHVDISTSELFYHKCRSSDTQKVEALSAIAEFAR